MQQRVLCSRCGSPNAFGQQFCGRCGNRLVGGTQQQTYPHQQTYQCSICGQPIIYGAQFCGNCRTPLIWPTQQQTYQTSSLLHCPYCGDNTLPGAQFCARCGKSLSQSGGQQVSSCSATSSTQMSSASTQNTSGQGERSIVPNEIKGWSWGAFLLEWIWGVSNSVWISLLALIPVMNLLVCIVLGIFGNEWAWRYKKWDSIESFKKTQRKWAIAGFIVVGIFIIISTLVFISDVLQPFSDAYQLFKEVEPWLSQ